MNTDWHSLGQHEKRWYYLHITDLDFSERSPISTLEVFIEEDQEPVYAEVENRVTVGDWKSLPDNIKSDINEIIAKLRKEHFYDEPDYEGYLEQQRRRERDAREAWAFRSSIR